MTTLSKNTFKFLKELKQNNNREWFTENKPTYVTAQENVAGFIDELISQMNNHDDIENTSGKKSMFRIYNDVRFKKDKTPYKSRFAFGLKRAGDNKRGGYYMHIEPGNCMLACGFFSPNPQDLLRIRKDIEINYDDWHELLNATELKNSFEPLHGDGVKTAPKGFAKDHPAIELLRFKQYIFKKDFTDAEVQSEDFAEKISETFKSIRPWLDYMSEVLTTNLNGESILE